MRGKGQTIGWSNEMHFRINDSLLKSELYLNDYYGIAHDGSNAAFTGEQFVELIESIKGSAIDTPLRSQSSVTRLEAARLIDSELDPFHTHHVTLDGNVTE